MRLTSFRPVVTRTALTENKVVGTEETAERTRANSIHGAGLEVNEDGARDIFVCTSLIVVDRNTLKLEVVVALVLAVVLDPVLVRNDFPELDTLKIDHKNVSKYECGSRNTCGRGVVPIWLPH